VDAKETLIQARPHDAVGTLDGVDLSALLRSVSALEMYRKRHGRIDHSQVIAFLVLDKWFPRSIRHCLEKGQESLRAITGASSEAPATRPERLLGRLAAEYEYAVTEEILAAGLHEHLDLLQSKLNDVGLAIFDTFFATRPDPVIVEEQAAQAAQ
jgi:uncharacterized alpha-E superfamily protein